MWLKHSLEDGNFNAGVGVHVLGEFIVGPLFHADYICRLCLIPGCACSPVLVRLPPLRCWFELDSTCAPSVGAVGDTVGAAGDRERDCLCKAISRHCACVCVGVGVGRITEVGSRIN